MEFPDIVEEESGCSFYCDRCVRWNKVYFFGDRIYNSHDGVVSRGLWKFDHKINAEHISLFIWNRERLKLVNWRVLPGFYLETEIAGTYILANILRHLGLPVVLEHQFQCLLTSRVPRNLGVIAKGYNLSA